MRVIVAECSVPVVTVVAMVAMVAGDVDREAMDGAGKEGASVLGCEETVAGDAGTLL